MIPILYEKTETAFTSEGLCRLPDCISCTVHEVRNGEYECEFEYPITGEHYADIAEGRIIAASHDETGDVQPFDIYAHSKPINGVVTFNAHHISYRQAGITVKPFTAGSVTAAIQGIKTNSANTNDFTYWTDKSTAGDFKVTEPKAARALLCGEEGSLLDVYGTGEYEFDRFNVKLHLHRGTDSGVEIRYGKNLVDIEDSVDYSDSYTGIVPYWYSDEDGIVNINNWILRSGNYSYGNRDIIIPMDFSGDFEEKPTAAQLETKATSKLSSSGAWLPSQTIKVDFVQLWQTEEYKEYAPLQRVHLCDTVNVIYPELGVTVSGVKVIETLYNVLLDRYDEMILGDAPQSYAALIADDVKIDTSGLATKSDIAGIESDIQTAVDNATDLITGGLGGHVVIKQDADGKPEEILIMNADDISTATKVWRWNVNGLGYSSTGYSGTYGTAITMDGSIVADYITTGTLTANLIKAGVISDTSGSNSWDMISGAMTLRNATFYGNNDQTITNISDTLYMRNESTAEDTAFIHLRDADIWNGSTVYKHARLWADKLTFTASDNSMATFQYVGARTMRLFDNLEAQGVIYAPTIGGLTAQYGSTLRYTTLNNTCNISALVDSAMSTSSTNPVQNKVINTALQSKADATDLTALAADFGQFVIDAGDTFAPKASPALTGTPTAPTATAGTSNAQIATTAFVQNAISGGRYAPINHASSATTYGIGNASVYGHLKLSDSTTSTSTTSDGVAATPKAVKTAKETAIDYTDNAVANLVGIGEIYGQTGTGSLVSTTAYTNITGDLSLPAGRWVVTAKVRFGSSKTASRRGLSIYNVTESAQYVDSLVQVNATSNGGAFHLTTCTIINLSARQSICARGMQNSNSNLDFDGYIQAIKIANY